VQQQSRDDLRTVRLGLELERGDHAEVAAAAANRPEQIRVLIGAGAAQAPVGRDDFGRDQVVGREAVAARDPAEPAAEREPGDPGRRDDPAGHDQPERLRRAVHVGPGGAGLDLHATGRRIDLDASRGREVQHQAVIAERGAGDVVAATADRQRQAAVPDEADAGGDLVGILGPDDQRRPALDHPVPDPVRLVVVGAPGPKCGVTQSGGERGETVAVAGDGRGPYRRGVGHGFCSR
jgi:hypothetical protein